MIGSIARWLWVVGEAGIGKTRLVVEALRSTAHMGTFMIALRCVSLERGLPFAPLSEALRPLLRAVPVDTLRRLPTVALAQVADLLPVLHERLPDLPMLAHPPAEGHNYLLDGLVDLALALAREQPLIIWCDDHSGRPCDAGGAGAAGSARVASRVAGGAGLSIWATWPKIRRYTICCARLGARCCCGRLCSAGSMMRKSRKFWPGWRAWHRREWLAWRRACGPVVAAIHCFFRSLCNRCWRRVAHDHWQCCCRIWRPARHCPILPVRRRCAISVLSRAERLPASARMLLEQLAVIGRPVSLDLIEQLAGSAGLESARMLLESQFLAEEADGRLSFSHDLVRSIIVAALMSPQRRLLHRAAATAIARLAW